jgi:hypothetical protein
MKKLMTFGVGAAFGLAMVATCGTNSTKHGLVDDAGTILSDAGKAVGDLLGVDLGIKDAAAAPTPMVGDCSQAEVQTETSASLVVTNTQYFAEFDPPGFDPTSNTTVTVTLCNYEYYGTTVDSYGAQPCVAGYTCTQSGHVGSVPHDQLRPSGRRQARPQLRIPDRLQLHRDSREQHVQRIARHEGVRDRAMKGSP